MYTAFLHWPTRATLGETTRSTFPYKTCLYEKKELARPDFDFRVLLLTGTNFLHINNRSIRERYCQLLARELRGQLNLSKQGPALQHTNKEVYANVNCC